MHGEEDREEEGIAVGKQKGGGVPLHYTYNKYLFSSQIHVYRDDCQKLNVLKNYRFLVNVTVSYAILS